MILLPQLYVHVTLMILYVHVILMILFVHVTLMILLAYLGNALIALIVLFNIYIYIYQNLCTHIYIM